ncbi:hypothetical protein TEA_001353 [Camellia sinensis var. sinensis]|uniref:Uncharacterized protein n=1 Tax=Camellia sinensis var. sinensis TaxID=542762 RepID=A0A4S4DE52_CAMSN|nr:hypothetical protein TEA_001353 [Camellia sinensis var. sinensis]
MPLHKGRVWRRPKSHSQREARDVVNGGLSQRIDPERAINSIAYFHQRWQRERWEVAGTSVMNKSIVLTLHPLPKRSSLDLIKSARPYNPNFSLIVQIQQLIDRYWHCDLVFQWHEGNGCSNKSTEAAVIFYNYQWK